MFFANFLCQLKPKVERITVVSPKAYGPSGLLRFPRFSNRRLILPHEWWRGIEVFRPDYLSAGAGSHMWFQSRMWCHSLMPLCCSLHRRHDFDVVIGYGFGTPAHGAQCVARTLGIPNVCWAIGSDVHAAPQQSAENVRLFMHNVRYTDAVLTESESLRQAILRRCPNARHVHTYYKGIDLGDLRELPASTEARAKLGLDGERTYMLSSGSVCQTKGVNEFYEAFRALADDFPKLSAIWVGGGPLQDSLQDRARKDGLSDRFGVTGNVPRSDVLTYMRAADVMAFPSYAEGLPNVVMEAMAAELPTISTDVGGVPEIIVEGVTGAMVRPRDSAALAERIRDVFAAPDRWRTMSRNARRVIMDHFDVERNAEIALSFLDRMVAGDSPSEPVSPCADVRPGEKLRDSLVQRSG